MAEDEPGAPSGGDQPIDEAAAQQSNKPAAKDHDELVDSAEMPFMAHVVELRQRLLRSLAAVGLLFLPPCFRARPKMW